MDFVVADDLVPQLRWQIHVTALADAARDFDDGGTAAARENQLVTRDQIAGDLRRDALSTRRRLGNRRIDAADFRLQLVLFFLPLVLHRRPLRFLGLDLRFDGVDFLHDFDQVFLEVRVGLPYQLDFAL